MRGQPRIDQLFAFVTVDDDGTEGVIGFFDARAGMAVAMMGADLARVEDLKRIAERDPMLRGRRIEILRFSDRKTIGTIDRTREPRLDAARRGTTGAPSDARTAGAEKGNR